MEFIASFSWEGSPSEMKLIKLILALISSSYLFSLGEIFFWKKSFFSIELIKDFKSTS